MIHGILMIYGRVPARHGGTPYARWMVSVNGKIPSFDSWMMTGGTPMTLEFTIYIYIHIPDAPCMEYLPTFG